MKKNKKLTAEMRALEKQRKAEQYRERELAKTEAEALEVTVKVEQPKEPKEFKEKKIDKYLKKQKRWQKQQENKKKAKERKKKKRKTPIDTTPVDTPIIESAPIFNTPVKPPSTPVAEPKPPKGTPKAWDGKVILDMMDAVERGLTDLKTQLEDDQAINYKGGGNRYTKATNDVYEGIGYAMKRINSAKDVINRFIGFKIPLNKDTVGEDYFREINEQYTVLSEWQELMDYSKYEQDYDNKTTVGTGYEDMVQKLNELDKLVSAIGNISTSIIRGTLSKGLKI